MESLYTIKEIDTLLENADKKQYLFDINSTVITVKYMGDDKVIPITDIDRSIYKKIDGLLRELGYEGIINTYYFYESICFGVDDEFYDMHSDSIDHISYDLLDEPDKIYIVSSNNWIIEEFGKVIDIRDSGGTRKTKEHG